MLAIIGLAVILGLIAMRFRVEMPRSPATGQKPATARVSSPSE